MVISTDISLIPFPVHNQVVNFLTTTVDCEAKNLLVIRTSTGGYQLACRVGSSGVGGEKYHLDQPVHTPVYPCVPGDELDVGERKSSP